MFILFPSRVKQEADLRVSHRIAHHLIIEQINSLVPLGTFLEAPDNDSI